MVLYLKGIADNSDPDKIFRSSILSTSKDVEIPGEEGELEEGENLVCWELYPSNFMAFGDMLDKDYVASVKKRAEDLYVSDMPPAIILLSESMDMAWVNVDCTLNDDGGSNMTVQSINLDTKAFPNGVKDITSIIPI